MCPWFIGLFLHCRISHCIFFQTLTNVPAAHVKMVDLVLMQWMATRVLVVRDILAPIVKQVLLHFFIKDVLAHGVFLSDSMTREKSFTLLSIGVVIHTYFDQSLPYIYHILCVLLWLRISFNEVYCICNMCAWYTALLLHCRISHCIFVQTLTNVPATHVKMVDLVLMQWMATHVLVDILAPIVKQVLFHVCVKDVHAHNVCSSDSLTAAKSLKLL